MTDSELYKLSKKELLEIMLAQGEEIENLRDQLRAANKKLEAREISIKEAGSIADAALKINNIFQDAEAASQQYLDSIKKLVQDEQEALARVRIRECELKYALARVNKGSDPD